MDRLTSKRYQDCPWYVKLWRRRWQLLVPYDALKMYRNNRSMMWPTESFAACWQLAIAFSHIKMNWMYDF